MKLCCKCKKIIWPWQKISEISASHIHLKCHQILINTAINNPKIKSFFIEEFKHLQQKGIKTSLKLNEK